MVISIFTGKEAALKCGRDSDSIQRHREYRFLGYACLRPRAAIAAAWGSGIGSGSTTTLRGRALRRVVIIESNVYWNFGVPGLAPVAKTCSSVISRDCGRYFS